MMDKPKSYILWVIVSAQFCCTSLWFAGNSIITDLILRFHLEKNALAHLTSAVQLGFVAGTLIFALLTLADRFSPSKLFFICALFGSLFNLGTILPFNSLFTLILFRFLTGILLAGIYPIGMKIAADYYDKGLGKSLGFLVGALVLGTAFPHFIKGFTNGLPWQLVVICTSAIAVFGGFLMLIFVRNGPYRKTGQRIDFTAFLKVFKNQNFKSAAFGYFGHMWELYAFWAFVPSILAYYAQIHPNKNFNISIYSFVIIGVGSLACICSGLLSSKYGAKKIATFALLLSGLCCVCSPFILIYSSFFWLIAFLIFWGMVVIADSPLFATLIAQNANPNIKGTALTIVNSIGFAITIVSIQFIGLIKGIINPAWVYLFLAIGPILGLIALFNPKPIDENIKDSLNH